jgi:hypothetical protein
LWFVVTFVANLRGWRAPARSDAVTSGQQIDSIDVALPAAGVITGTVLNESGQPLVSAPVWHTLLIAGLLRQSARYWAGGRTRGRKVCVSEILDGDEEVPARP